MSQAEFIRRKIKQLRYDREYDYSVFEGIAGRECVKKTISRSPDLVAKTVNGKFYRIRHAQTHDLFDPVEYSFNPFWQSGEARVLPVSAIIRNTLAALNPRDIQTLCRKYGHQRVKAELIAKYKELYQAGYIETPGMRVPLTGRYDRNPIFLQILRHINDRRAY